MSRNLEIAKEIQRQLGSQLIILTGAYQFVAIENGLQFRIKGSRKVQQIQIALNSRDTYDLRFLKYRKFDIVHDEKVEDIYFDSLGDVIENHTGLYVSLYKR